MRIPKRQHDHQNLAGRPDPPRPRPGRQLVWRQLAGPLVMVLVSCFGGPSGPPCVVAQEASAPLAPPAESTPAAGQLQFSFAGTPWRDVIQWLAEEAGLALHVGDMPAGSFTYSDPRKYTNEQAIERVNLFLLSQGYTLVRSGQMLSLINLDDPRSLQQLDALAQLVSVDDLAERSD
jgi:hypothetical protein